MAAVASNAMLVLRCDAATFKRRCVSGGRRMRVLSLGDGARTAEVLMVGIMARRQRRVKA